MKGDNPEVKDGSTVQTKATGATMKGDNPEVKDGSTV